MHAIRTSLIWSRPQYTSTFLPNDQSYMTAVTTSTFPNMHTFLRGPEFCLMVRKLKSSCRTSKNVTLEEQYPRLCSLIGE